MHASTHTSGAWLPRLLAGVLAMIMIAALAPAAQAGSHDDEDGGPPDDSGPPDDAGGGSGEVDERDDGITRVSGANRFMTAVALSGYSHDGDADEVFVATGFDFADALTAAPAAAAADAPMLFTPPGNLMRQVADEIETLSPETITVPGGPAAVEPRVVEQLEEVAPDAEVVRIGGGDRFDTAVEISQSTHPDGSDDVFLATGGRFPDALAGAPVATSLDAPVLLSTPDMVPESTTAEIERLEAETVTVLGGPGAISDDVLDELEAELGVSTQRIAGDDRFETAIEASRFLTDDGETETAYVATGLGWADALAGAAAAGADASPVLLTTPGQLPDAVVEELQRLAPEEVVVLGGPGAITERVADEIAEAIGASDEGDEGDDENDEGDDEG